MNHQPFEKMLLDDGELSPIEKEKLMQHLTICPQCAKLEQSLRTLDHEFKSTVVVAPAAGFATRWQENLPARRRQHEREQTRIILISMAVTFVATSITLAAFLLPPISPITIIANLFTDMVKLINSISQFWNFTISFFRAVPAGLSIGIALSISVWLSITLLAWGISLYRITSKGIRTTS
jgi:hypothetical protein